MMSDWVAFQVYSADREVTISYESSQKDCRPRFESPLYQMEIDANATASSSPKIVGKVSAESCGSETDIQVSLFDHPLGFKLEQLTVLRNAFHWIK